MKIVMMSLLLSFGTLTAGCGKSESTPCQGGGMAVDPRPLPEAWGNKMPIPDGAVACHDETGDGDEEYRRSYELGASPHEGLSMWRKNLVGNGWAMKGESPDETFFTAQYELNGATIELKVSKKVEDKGWATLTYKPAP